MKRLLLSLVLVALIMLPAHFGYAKVDETIVVYLPFDEGSGDVVKDKSSYGHEGKIGEGTKWVAGKFGGALEFSGDSLDTVIIEPVETLKIIGEITMMAWVKVPDMGISPADRNQIISKKVHDDGEFFSYGLGIFSGGAIRMFLGSGSSRPTTTGTSDDFNKNKEDWHHVAGTYDGTLTQIYLNGEQLVDNVARSKGAEGAFEFQATNDWPVRIGCATHDARYTMNGIIDDVVIYSRALDANEITQVMNNGPLAVSQEGKLTTTWANVKN